MAALGGQFHGNPRSPYQNVTTAGGQDTLNTIVGIRKTTWLACSLCLHD